MPPHDAKKNYSFGRWLIERERCRIEDFRPPPPEPENLDIATGINGLLKKMGLEKSAWTTRIEQNWPALVGKQVAGHTRPGMLQGKELTVYVDSSVWLSELQRYGLADMLRNVQAHTGANQVVKIRLQLDPDR